GSHPPSALPRLVMGGPPLAALGCSSATFGGPGFPGASLALSSPSRPFASSGLPCGPASRRSRPSATGGTLRLCPPGRLPASADGSFLRGLPPPSGLRCCASDGVNDASRCARYSFKSSIHARLRGVSYRTQDGRALAFFLLVHIVHLPSCES